ncbi:MAG TPA: hypothetical protein VK752_06120 [Bryobacteraceae bacterium]|jgi:dienelactone hydrolase|nr:hypothetical protein [Bryobacteraceae bacterium]
MIQSAYDPFTTGPFLVEAQRLEARDPRRDRVFQCEAWYPATNPGRAPLVIFSHHSGGNRRAATFLTTHLATHGYVVAGLDHSESFVPELKGKIGETAAERAARIEGIVGSRVPDVRFLIDYLLAHAPLGLPALDPGRIGIVGHSAGGWTALATPEFDERIRAVVALAPGGASNPKPGILPATLSFAWSRPPATLFLIAEQDVFLPIQGMYELYDRTPGSKQMVILRRADHLHFIDNVEENHERTRATGFPPPADWIPHAMRPITELCSGEEARTFVRGLTLAHLDAVLNNHPEASRLLNTDLPDRLTEKSIDAFVGLRPRN